MKIAVICGVLRQPFEFGTVMDRLLLHRAAGKLDRIILSTWRGEVDRQPGIGAMLSAAGVTVIETAPPVNLGPGNINAQKKALLQALLRVPADATVMKLRTDKSAVLVDRYVERLQSPLTPADMSLSTLRHRVVVSRLSSTLPFMADDFVFIGQAADLMRMTMGSDSLSEFFREMLPTAEMTWMYPPLARRDLLLENFFATMRTRRFSLEVMKRTRESGEIPPPVLRFLAHYWQIAHGSFEVVHRAPTGREFRPTDLLREAADTKPHVRDLGEYMSVTNEEVFRQVVSTLLPAEEFGVATAVSLCSELAAIFPDAVTHDLVERAPDPAGQAPPRGSFLDAVLSAAQAETPEAERRALAQIMTEEGRRSPFQNVLTQIGRAYLNGERGLPRRPEMARYWGREGARMRDPQAVHLLVSLHNGPAEAVRDPDVTTALAASGVRDSAMFRTLAEAMLVGGVETTELPREKLLRTLRALATRGDVAAAAMVERFQ